MSKEAGPDIYDSLMSAPRYLLSAQETPYFPVWERILSELNYNDKVIEYGCGTGQLADYLILAGINYELGIDFAPKNIERAKKLTGKNCFEVGNILETEWYKLNTNTAILTEVLEHIDNDLQVLKNIQKGTKVIFSVPNFNSATHVRKFATVQEVIFRYAEYFEGLKIECFKISNTNTIYLCVGTKI